MKHLSRAVKIGRLDEEGVSGRGMSVPGVERDKPRSLQRSLSKNTKVTEPQLRDQAGGHCADSEADCWCSVQN